MGKLLIIIGLICLLFGLAILFKIPFPFGRLPGDIAIKRESFQFYFPIVSSIVLSIIISILFYIFSKI
jgi:hypothetical protein